MPSWHKRVRTGSPQFRRFCICLQHRYDGAIMDKARFEQLRNLSPVEAARAWLDGAFGIDEEPALIEAIRKDKRIKLSDEAIIDFFVEAMEDDWDAQHCLDELASRS